MNLLTSIVIVNWNTRELIRNCVETVRKNTSFPYEIIVVDNGSTDGSVEVIRALQGDDLKTVFLDENKGYAAGNNCGIAIAEGEYICLLNSDAFVTSGWLKSLVGCLENTGAGMVGPWTNRCKGGQRHKPKYRLLPSFLKKRHEVDYLSFFCVLIHTKVIDQIGMLDERFGLGTFEDDDYCRRARSVGFSLVVDSRSWVWHEANATMKANNLTCNDLMDNNRSIYDKKWIVEDYFLQERSEVLEHIPAGVSSALEVGCGAGTFGKLLAENLDIGVWGVEPSEDAAQLASDNLKGVFCGTFDEYCAQHEEQFDMLVFNDVLEHLVDPWGALEKCKLFLKSNGCVVASIPNVRFYRNVKRLIRAKDWKYEDKGILDRTHLRFFTRKSMIRMFEECGYRVEQIGGVNPIRRKGPYILNFLLRGAIEDMLFAQYVVVVRVAD